MARPMPPAPPKPLRESPAAMYRPRTSGTGPTRGPASGVIASGWQTSFLIPASWTNGKRRAAPASSGSNCAWSGGSEAPGVLVVDRSGNHEGAGHGGDRGSPDATRHDDDLGLDRAVVGAHGMDRTAGRELDTGGATEGVNPGAQLPGRRGQGMGRGMRVEVAVPGHPHRAVERVLADDRHQASRLTSRYELDVQPDAARPRERALEL